MKLSEFIEETLVEIAEGASKANERYKTISPAGRVNPSGHMQIEGFSYTKQGFYHSTINKGRFQP